MRRSARETKNYCVKEFVGYDNNDPILYYIGNLFTAGGVDRLPNFVFNRNRKTTRVSTFVNIRAPEANSPS